MYDVCMCVCMCAACMHALFDILFQQNFFPPAIILGLAALGTLTITCICLPVAELVVFAPDNLDRLLNSWPLLSFRGGEGRGGEGGE